jgi:ribosomal protein L11 methyltransferase
VTDPQWIEVTARVAPLDVELVSEALRAVAGDDASIVVEPAIAISDDADFAYEVLDAPSLVRAYLEAPLTDARKRALRRRLAALPLTEALPPLAYREVREADWAEEWKRFYGILHAGERLVVKPSWEAYDASHGEVVVELDPGTAFGTGQHETTRLCLAALEAHVRTGMRVLDLGAGSGILAVAAAKLGASEVVAVDIDADTVAVAIGNAERNGVASRIRAAAGSLGHDWPWPDESPEGAFDLLVANISSTVLARLIDDCVGALKPGGVFIGSGFIETNAAQVLEAVTDAGLDVSSVTEEAEWRCVVATKQR